MQNNLTGEPRMLSMGVPHTAGGSVVSTSEAMDQCFENIRDAILQSPLYAKHVDTISELNDISFIMPQSSKYTHK